MNSLSQPPPFSLSLSAISKPTPISPRPTSPRSPTCSTPIVKSPGRKQIRKRKSFRHNTRDLNQQVHEVQEAMNDIELRDRSHFLRKVC